MTDATVTPKPRKDWIQTLEGRQLFPRDLRVEQVGSIEEIAHSLAANFRFTRQTGERYSVAQHCVLGSSLLPPAFAGAFLLHELSEVYLPDIAGPLKPYVSVELTESCDECGGEGSYFDASHSANRRCICDEGQRRRVIRWEDLEQRHLSVILDALNLSSLLPLVVSREVKRVDLEMLAAEKRDLCSTEPAPWGLPHGCDHIAPITHVWNPMLAKQQFLTRFNELFK